MFLRTLLIPFLLRMLFLEGDAPAADGDAAGGASEGEGKAGDKGKGVPATPAPDKGAAASGTPAPAVATGAEGEDPRVVRANAQAAAARVAKTEAETKLEGMKKAVIPFLRSLGFELPEGVEADPEKLQTEVDSWKAKYRQERISNTIQRIATAEGAKAELLLRYLKGGDELAALDPDDRGFEDAAKAVVQAAIASEPTLKSAQAAPGRSGADFSAGATGATRSIEERIREAQDKGDGKTVIALMEEFAAAKAPAGTA